MKILNEAQKMNQIALENEGIELRNVKNSIEYIDLCDKIHSAALKGEFQLSERFAYYNKVEQENCNNIMRALENDGFIIDASIYLRGGYISEVVEKVVSISWA